MQIYNVYQSGKRLYIDEKENPDNKIVVNKYDNMQQTLRLISDGTLPPRLYWALRNPKLSQKYFILKLINNEDLIVGTDISATPGLWDMLLIGTPDDYIIEGADIDQSKLTYVSDHFGRLFVRDNFLEELDFEEQTSPTFRVFYDEIMFQLGEKADAKDIPDKMSDLENDTNFISGVALKDDGEGNVEIVGTTFVGGETEEGEIPSGGSVEVDDELDEESTNPVQNKVIAKEVISLKERNAKLKETIEKLQIKVTTEKASFHNIKDSANMKVVDFGMEGKTTQDGTPTPENQVEIVNAGVYNEETGRYEHKLKFHKKNFFDVYAYREAVDGVVIDKNDILITKSAKTIYYDLYVPEGQYVFNAGVTNYISVVLLDDEENILINASSFGPKLSTNFSKETSGYCTLKIYGGGFNANDSSLYRRFSNLQIERDGATDFEAYVGKSITLTSPVPLTKWDYLTKRDGVWGWSIWSLHYTFNGSEAWYSSASRMGFSLQCLPEAPSVFYKYNTGYCSQATYYNATFGVERSQENSFNCGSINNVFNILKNSFYDDTLSDYGLANWKAHLAEHPLELITYAYEEQAFHPLLEEEQELLHNLETYYGVTNLYNDQGCPMWLCYTCDSKLYVDKKLEQINNALLSLGANV